MSQLAAGAAFVTASDGVRLYAEAHGAGEPVLFSPGYCQTHENFRPQVASFTAAGFRVVLWDYRGHGQSDVPESPNAYSMAQVVDDLGRVLDWAAPGRRAVVGGLSFGGLASLHFALAHPEGVRALLLFASGPGFKNPEAQARWEAQVGRVADRLEERGFEGSADGRAAPTAIGLRPELPAAQAAGRAIQCTGPAPRPKNAAATRITSPKIGRLFVRLMELLPFLMVSAAATADAEAAVGRGARRWATAPRCGSLGPADRYMISSSIPAAFMPSLSSNT